MLFKTYVAGLLGLAGAAAAADLNSGARGMLDKSMSWMDSYYDPNAGYLYDFEANDGTHETRHSVWYACGLLARNDDGDVDRAETIFQNVIKAQYKDPTKEWYGGYQQSPEEPAEPQPPVVIYRSWDPNWRGFIGTALIVAIEEYSDLLSDGTKDLIVESIYNATVGDSYRTGSTQPGKDNLFPAYSNPAIMRAFAAGWAGRRLKDDNMTRDGDEYAQEIIDLFNQHDTLSEFNSPTYTGVSLYGLVLWSTYLPDDSIMAQNGPRMVIKTWESVAQVWHPGLRNMAGPWDRAYGYDMHEYLSLMALWLWPIIGQRQAGLANQPETMLHVGDYCYAPLMAILTGANSRIASQDTLDSLKSFGRERTYNPSAYSPPYDNTQRDYSMWLDRSITIGGVTFDQIQAGGASRSTEVFNPAVVQWDTGHEVGWIRLWTTQTALDSKVESGKLTLHYPKGAVDSQFRFLVSTFANRWVVNGWEDVPGLSVNVTGDVNPEYTVERAGDGGPLNPSQGFDYWNFVYNASSATPTIEMQFSVD